MTSRTLGDFTWQVFKVHAQGDDLIALDIETTVEDNPWLNTPKLVSVALAFDEHRAFVFDAESLEKVRHVLEHRKFIMHNGLFDKLALEAWFGFKVNLVHDTMAMQYLLDPDGQGRRISKPTKPNALETLVQKYLDKAPYKNVDYKNILDEPWQKVVQMNGDDAINTWDLFHNHLKGQINEDPALSRIYQWILMPAINELIKITQKGIPLNRERLAEVTASTEEEVAQLLDELREATPLPREDKYPKGWPKPSWWRVGKHGQYYDEHPGGLFNPGSPDQVKHILFDLWELPVLQFTKSKDGITGKMEETDRPSTNADVLLLLETYHSKGSQQEWLHKLRKYRKATKLLSYYTSWPDLVDEKDWLHPRYKPLHVVTGRLSADSPNIMQVPRQKEVRSCFGDVEGYTWMKADYSQIELRLAALAAEEHTMLNAYREGADIHRMTAELVLGKSSDAARQVGKTLNFGLLYGAGAGTLQRIARNDYDVFLTLDQARYYREEFFRAYPGLAMWHEMAEAEIEASGMSRTPLGRIRYLPKAKWPRWEKDLWPEKMAAIREGINHRIQGFASDLLLMSLNRIGPQVRELGAFVVAEVHDEIDLLVPHENVSQVAGIVKATMEDVSWLSRFGIKLDVPVVADVETGPNWGELKGME